MGSGELVANELSAARRGRLKVTLTDYLPPALRERVRVTGHDATRWSLYERDAYQVQLRLHPEQRSALRFAVQWGSRDTSRLLLRVELRGNRGKNGTTATIESPVRYRGIFTTWSNASLSGEAYKNFGELSAWRATLWDGEQLVAEQKSFLW